MTVNAFLSVSLEPPTVLVSLSRRADTTPLVQASRRFGLSILGSGQRHLSELFASRLPSAQKFQEVAYRRGSTGTPLLEGALAAMECEVVEEVEHATHQLFFGRVLALTVGPEGLPLVFWESRYAVPGPGGRLVMSSARPRPVRAAPRERGSRPPAPRRRPGRR